MIEAWPSLLYEIINSGTPNGKGGNVVTNCMTLPQYLVNAQAFISIPDGIDKVSTQDYSKVPICKTLFNKKEGWEGARE